MNLGVTRLTVEQWRRTIDRRLERPGDSEPIVNIDPEDPREFDAIFLGGGAAGRFGSAYLRAMGGRQLIIDRWPFLGGSCPHNACVPHHLFSECAAQLMLERTFSGQLWFQTMKGKRIDLKAIVDLFREGRTGPHAMMNYQSREQLDLEFILNTPATIVDNRTVEAGGQRFSAKHLVIAFGARPRIPDIAGIESAGVFTYASLVEQLDDEPGGTAVVIGGGKTAVEYGCFFNATGRRTIIVCRDRILPMIPDHECRDYVLTMMAEQGIEWYEHSALVEVLASKNGTVRSAVLETPDGERRIDTDFIFLGLGSIPNSGMASRKLGVATDHEGFIRVDAHMQTSVPGVYAVGDVVGAPMEMFKARKSGVCAARNIMGDNAEYAFEDYPDFLHSHYEICWFGMGERQARETFPAVTVLKLPPHNPDGWNIALPASDRTMLYSMKYPRMSGFQKLVVNSEDRRILGAFHVGYGAKDGFPYLYRMARQGMTIDELGDMDELFLNPSQFIQLCRLRAGSPTLSDL